MNTPTVTHSPDTAQPGAVQSLRNHHHDLRNKAIKKYRNAEFWTVKRGARSDALHHAKLVRMLEGRA